MNKQTIKTMEEFLAASQRDVELWRARIAKARAEFAAMKSSPNGAWVGVNYRLSGSDVGWLRYGPGGTWTGHVDGVGDGVTGTEDEARQWVETTVKTERLARVIVELWGECSGSEEAFGFFAAGAGAMHEYLARAGNRKSEVSE